MCFSYESFATYCFETKTCPQCARVKHSEYPCTPGTKTTAWLGQVRHFLSPAKCPRCGSKIQIKRTYTNVPVIIRSTPFGNTIRRQNKQKDKP